MLWFWGRSMLIIISFWVQIDICRAQLNLFLFIGIKIIFIVRRTYVCCLRVPVATSWHNSIFLVPINYYRLLLNIATSKYWWLQILLLSSCIVKTLTFQRRCCFNCTRLSISPVNSWSHKSTISFIFLHAMNFNGITIEFFSKLFFWWYVILNWQFCSLWSFD